MAGRDRSAKGWFEPRKVLERVAINAVAIWVASWLIDGITIGDWQALLLTGLIFGLVNSFIKPVIKRLTCPLYVVTLGLFALVINATMFALSAWIADLAGFDFHIHGPTAALLGALVVGVVAWFVSLVL